MKAKIYVETTVFSYLTARPSRDIVLLAHQQETEEWWQQRERYDIYISQFVVDEAAAGDGDAASRRLAALSNLPLLDANDAVVELAEALVSRGGLAKKAQVDALHVASAAVHGMDYLLTWNCRHIANAALRGKIEEICRASGFSPPVICTPPELVGEEL
jgi:predicted nucleic acid-binding protein